MTTFTVAAFDGSTYELTGTVVHVHGGYLAVIEDADGARHVLCLSHLTPREEVAA